MQAKIIQVIEICEPVPQSTAIRRRYFLPDGAELEPARMLRAGDVAMVTSDGRMFAGPIGGDSGDNFPAGKFCKTADLSS